MRQAPFEAAHAGEWQEFDLFLENRKNPPFDPAQMPERYRRICHELARTRMVEPGDFIQATDSHTCMGGANNALTWGVGATEYAALIQSGFTQVEVPESIRFELVGKLEPNVTAKDLMLYILKGRVRHEYGLGEVAHRVAVPVVESAQDAPLLDADPLLREALGQPAVDLPLGLAEEVRQVRPQSGLSQTDRPLCRAPATEVPRLQPEAAPDDAVGSRRCQGRR